MLTQHVHYIHTYIHTYTYRERERQGERERERDRETGILCLAGAVNIIKFYDYEGTP